MVRNFRRGNSIPNHLNGQYLFCLVEYVNNEIEFYRPMEICRQYPTTFEKKYTHSVSNVFV